MPRYINAERFNNFDYGEFDGRLTEDAVQGIETVLRAIDNAPTADVQEVRHGKWKWYSDMVDVRCDLCGRFANQATDYCPNCGAKMDAEEGDE